MSAADADDSSTALCEAVRRMLNSAYGAERIEVTTELCCAVADTAPLCRGAPHVVSSVCGWYRERMPRRQWLQALSAVIAEAAAKRSFGSGAPAADTCRHCVRDADGAETHAVPDCVRCSVYAAVLAALLQCISADAEVRGSAPRFAEPRTHP